MLETLTSCPVCQQSDFTPFLICKDFTVSQETFNLVSCNHCGFTFTNPRPDEEAIGAYYQSESYISHSNTRKGLINQIYHIVRQRALKSKLQLVNKLYKAQNVDNQTNRSLLDYGCGTGAFLDTCQKDAWQIEGLEPDANARKQAKEITQKEIKEHIFESYFDDLKFNVITLWHVLEHVHRLDETLERLKSLLKKQGNIIIAVPNFKAWEAEVFQEYWAGYDVPRHLYHFSPSSMETLLQRHQMKVTQKLPMLYDSYYISLLSNRYQFGSANYLKSFLQGLQSNRKASKSGNYSSLMYIVELLEK